MKRIIKGIFLLGVIVLSLVFLYPIKTYALTDETSYVDITYSQSFDVGELTFNNIVFKDYSSTSTKAFGLSGTVINNSYRDIDYTATVYYYDSNYNFIAKRYNLLTAISGTNIFNQCLT